MNSGLFKLIIDCWCCLIAKTQINLQRNIARSPVASSRQFKQPTSGIYNKDIEKVGKGKSRQSHLKARAARVTCSGLLIV